MHKSFVLMLLLFFVSFSLNAASEQAMQRSQQFINALLAVKHNEEHSYNKVDEFINFDYIMTESIKPSREKLNESQANALKTKLTQLIRLLAYPRAGEYFKYARYKFENSQKVGNKMSVLQSVYLPTEDMDVELSYLWQNFEGKWQIVDISVDEDSMVEDYQNQFSRIINKDGADSLLQKVSDKLIEAQRKTK